SSGGSEDWKTVTEDNLFVIRVPQSWTAERIDSESGKPVAELKFQTDRGNFLFVVWHQPPWGFTFGPEQQFPEIDDERVISGHRVLRRTFYTEHWPREVRLEFQDMPDFPDFMVEFVVSPDQSLSASSLPPEEPILEKVAEGIVVLH